MFHGIGLPYNQVRFENFVSDAGVMSWCIFGTIRRTKLTHYTCSMVCLRAYLLRRGCVKVTVSDCRQDGREARKEEATSEGFVGMRVKLVQYAFFDFV